MKKVFTFLSALLVSAAGFAQWTKPVPTALDAYEYSTMAEDGAGDTIVYYLYNKDAGAFYTQGNAWGTQTTIGHTGLKVAISKYINEEESSEWDGKTVLVNDYVDSKSIWARLFIDDETHAYVDHVNQPNYFWEIEAQGGGLFRIKPADINPNYTSALYGNGGSVYFGVTYENDPNTTIISPLIDIAEDNTAKVDWQFISEETYEIYLTAYEIYAASEDLKATIENAKEIGVDYADAQKVYDNTSSSIEELKDAKNALQKAINDKVFGGATEDNPQDVTEWLLNADFSSGDISGWDCTFVSGTNANNVGYQEGGEGYTNGDIRVWQFIEAWASDGARFNKNIEDFSAIGVGQLSQTIENMPAGKYKFTVDCIAVQQWNAPANPVTGVQLFATGGNIDIYKSIATGNAIPEHFEIVFVNDGANVTLGLRTTEECTANWIAADNFTLTYYGPTDEDPYKIVLDAAIEEMLAKHPIDGIENVKAYIGDKEAYQAAIEEAQAATADYLSYVEKIQDAAKVFETSIEAYNAYATQIENARDYLAEHDLTSIEADYLADYLMEDNLEEPGEYFTNGSADYILTNCLLTVEEITAETESVAELLKSAIANSLNEGDDCTDMIVNASFKDGFNGWTNKGGTFGGLVDFPCVEVFENVVDCYQVVNNVPDGIYSLSLKGFEYPTPLTDEDVESKVLLYMNDFQTPIQSIVKGGIPKDEAINYVNSFTSGGTPAEDFYNTGGTTNADDLFTDSNGNELYIPAGMSGASYAFRAGRYNQKVYGLIEGGTMKVGLTSNGVTARWVLWSDFKFTYEGKSAKAYSEALTAIIEPLKKYLANNSEAMTEAGATALSKAVDDAEAALANMDTEEMYTAITGASQALIEAKANVAAVEAFNVALNNLDAAIDGATNPSTSVMEEYYALIEQMDKAMTLTTEELAALTEKMKEIAAALRVPASDNASDDNPIDFTSVIINADIEETANVGWENTKNGGNGPVLASGISGQSIEFWNGSAANLQFNVWQTLSQLPAGKYKLSADAANSLNGEADNGADGRAYLYALTSNGNAASTAVSVQAEGCTEKWNNYSIIFTLAEGEDVTIGFQSVGMMAARWFVADNFTLEYYGTASAQEDSADSGQVDIAGVDANTSVSATGIYTISGTQVSSLQKGINIVKYANGQVKKVIIK